jgi:hypothetical protein
VRHVILVLIHFFDRSSLVHYSHTLKHLRLATATNVVPALVFLNISTLHITGQ